MICPEVAWVNRTLIGYCWHMYTLNFVRNHDEDILDVELLTCTRTCADLLFLTNTRCRDMIVPMPKALVQTMTWSNLLYNFIDTCFVMIGLTALNSSLSQCYGKWINILSKVVINNSLLARNPCHQLIHQLVFLTCKMNYNRKQYVVIINSHKDTIHPFKHSALYIWSLWDHYIRNNILSTLSGAVVFIIIRGRFGNALASWLSCV